MNEADRLLNASRAAQHNSTMSEIYAEDIARSVERTVEYTGTGAYPLGLSDEQHETLKVELVNMTTQQAIASVEHTGKTAVLNFASYKHPGGGYMTGMMAQEEALCHDSTLYNVLSQYDSTYYDWNRKHLNNGLYMDRALYTPGINFTLGGAVDILTCAAPNLKPVLMYKKANADEILKVQIQRVAFICSILEKQQVETAILGAWGCGVFKNDPYTIAYLFDYFTWKMSGPLKHIVYAIPDAKYRPNYRAFHLMLNAPGELTNFVGKIGFQRALNDYEKFLK